MRHAVEIVMVASNSKTTVYIVGLASGQITTKSYPRESMPFTHYDRISALANTGRYRMTANSCYPGFSLMRRIEQEATP